MSDNKIEDYHILFVDILHKEYESSRTGIHLSDLLYCPRQSYFRNKLGIRHNEQTLANFFDGQGIHEKMQKLLTKHYPNRFKMEDKHKVGDILTFTPDITDTFTNTIIEVKTTRSITVKYGPKPDHVQQLKAYLAFSNMYRGIIFYHVIINEQNEDLFVQHAVTLDYNEAKQIRDYWLVQAEQLRLAIKMNDPRLAYHIANNPTKNWLCKGYCNYLEHCPEGQAAIKAKEEANAAKANAAAAIKQKHKQKKRTNIVR